MSTATNKKSEKLKAIYGSSRAAHVPGTWYVAAYEVAPDADGQGGTEMTYAGYARVVLSNNDAELPPPSVGDNEQTNANDIEFPTPPADTNPCVAVALHGHPTNDDVWDYETLPDPISALANEPLLIPAGALILTIP